MERKFITYFEEQGNDYTDDLIKAVHDKLEATDDIKRVLIASSTGESALKLYGALDEFDVEIINVTHHMGFSGPNEADISEDMVKKLEDYGIRTLIGMHAFSGAARGVTNKYGGYSPCRCRHIENVFPWCKGLCGNLLDGCRCRTDSCRRKNHRNRRKGPWG